jgi:Kinesin motor domain
VSREERGIIPRAIEHIFNHIEDNEDPSIKYIVRGSYLQIYNDTIMDMLQPGKPLAIRESARRGVYVQGIRYLCFTSNICICLLVSSLKSALQVCAIHWRDSWQRTCELVANALCQAT